MSIQEYIIKKALEEGKDPHEATAAYFFNVSTDKVTPEQRQVCKQRNYTYLYSTPNSEIKRQQAQISTFSKVYGTSYEDYVKEAKSNNDLQMTHSEWTKNGCPTYKKSVLISSDYIDSILETLYWELR